MNFLSIKIFIYSRNIIKYTVVQYNIKTRSPYKAVFFHEFVILIYIQVYKNKLYTKTVISGASRTWRPHTMLIYKIMTGLAPPYLSNLVEVNTFNYNFRHKVLRRTHMTEV